MYKSCALNFEQMVDGKDVAHIQLHEVPKTSHLTRKSMEGIHLSFYDNLLQISERWNGMVYDLDSMKEVYSIENIDQLQDPDKIVHPGFIISTSKFESFEEEIFIRRK